MGLERRKRLEKLFRSVSGEEAKEIDSLMTQIRKVSGNKAELIMKRINKLIGGHGVEAIRGNYVSRYYGDIIAVYVNKGDTYNTTILFNTRTKMPMITTMGDWVSSNNRKYGIQ